MAIVRGLEHSSWAEHHRTSCVRPVDGQGQGGATGRQRDMIRKKKKLRLEEGQGVGRGFLTGETCSRDTVVCVSV